MGFDPAGFWHLTPRELKYYFDGATRRLEREHNERAWLAWHMAALGRAKRLPKLQRLQARRAQRRQSWQEQMKIMDMWIAATQYMADKTES